MTIEDEYRKHAERCRLLAEASHKPTDRAFWLLLAQNWQLLAQDSEEEMDPDSRKSAAALAPR